MAHRDVRGVRLLTRNGNDFTERFPAIADAMGALKVKSCVIDGEAIVTNSNGLTVFNLLRRQNGDDVELCAFDLLEHRTAIASRRP